MVSLECIEKKQNIKFPEVYTKLYQSNFKGISKMKIQVDEDSINIRKFLNANEINDVLDEFYDYFGLKGKEELPKIEIPEEIKDEEINLFESKYKEI